jgi:hypothetical protein
MSEVYRRRAESATFLSGQFILGEKSDWPTGEKPI